jgi:hypothetical protein
MPERQDHSTSQPPHFGELTDHRLPSSGLDRQLKGGITLVQRATMRETGRSCQTAIPVYSSTIGLPSQDDIRLIRRIVLGILPDNAV